MKKNAKSAKLGDWSPADKSDLAPCAMFEQLCKKREKNCKAPLFDDVYQVLFDRLQGAPIPAFHLRATFQYLAKVNESFPIVGKWTLNLFEIWLSWQKELDNDLKLSIRSKIIGRHLPRSAYQILFPIGGDQIFWGTHVVTAHISPDLDTCIASLWGWADAFAACLSRHAHSWNLPGGVLAPQDQLIVDQLMGPELLQQLPTDYTQLRLKALDLIDSKALLLLQGEKSMAWSSDLSGDHIAVMVNESGSFLGDLNRWDWEELQPILSPIFLSLQWLIEQLETRCSAKNAKVDFDDSTSLRSLRLNQIPSIAALPEKSSAVLDQFTRIYFGLISGLETKLVEVCQGIISFSGLRPFSSAADILMQLLSGEAICEKRDALLQQLKSAIGDAQKSLQRLDLLIDIKTKIFGRFPRALSANDELLLVRAELQKSPAVCVVLREKDCATPIGAIFSSQLDRLPLGTVTLRDFCNGQEIALPSHLQIISVLDHHKTDLRTPAVTTFCSADVQSCNVLIAELTLSLNDRCARSDGDLRALQEQAIALSLDQNLSENREKLRLLQRLIARCLAAMGNWYVHPEREMVEYLSLLHAIFDDTDLLMKSTPRDVRCVVRLLNRAKSLQCEREVEILNEDGIEENEMFSRRLATRILQHKETYSLYSKVFAYRFKNIESALANGAMGEDSSWFSDTKEQNGYARIGQSKLFAGNIKTFAKLCPKLRAHFADLAKKAASNSNLILHLHMCSTIIDADQVHRGQDVANYSHRDQLWFWIPDAPLAGEMLKNFLASFCQAKELQGQKLHLEIFNDRGGYLKKLFEERFALCTAVAKFCNLLDQAIAVLYVKASSLNSRKAAIAPHLPPMRSIAPVI